MAFTPGKTYSRKAISAAIGGSTVSYLPKKDGKIICGCFDTRKKYNPEAPDTVTIGRLDRPEPEMVATQKEPIPVFLRSSPGEWKYVGRWKCTGLDTRQETRDKENSKNPSRLHGVQGVLYFKRVGD